MATMKITSSTNPEMVISTSSEVSRTTILAALTKLGLKDVSIMEAKGDFEIVSSEWVKQCHGYEKDSHFLSCLEQWGVDNWSGFDEARAQFREEWEEIDD